MADRYTRVVERSADLRREPTASTVTVSRRRSSISSRICHIILILPFLLAIALSTLSFASLYTKKDAASNGCPLYAKYSSQKLQRGPDSSCMMSMWGEVAVAGLSLLAVLWLVVLAVAGLKVLSSRSVVAMLLFLILFIISTTISSSTTVGLGITCSSIESERKACSEFIPFDILYQAEVASWSASGVLLLTVFIWMIIAVASCCKSCRKNRQFDRERASLITNGPVNSRRSRSAARVNGRNAFEDSGTVPNKSPPNNRRGNHRRSFSSDSCSSTSD